MWSNAAALERPTAFHQQVARAILPVVPRPAHSPRRPTVWAQQVSGRTSIGLWIAGALVLAALGAALYAQFAPLLGSPIAPPQPRSVARAVLEPAPDGTTLSIIVQDEMGRDIAFAGTLTGEIQEPEGQVVRLTRTVTPSDFGPLPNGSIVAGRLGYRLSIPAGTWSRPPRRGGTTRVAIAVSPQNAPPFTSTFTQPFP